MDTSSLTQTVRLRRRLALAVAGLAVAACVILLVTSLIGGYGLNLRAFGRAVLNVALAVRSHNAVAANEGDLRNIVFLHHSVGERLIAQGEVRERLSALGYRLWDQDYNWKGLRDPSGIRTGYSYNVPGDNTDPDGLLRIFSQPVFGLPLNTLSGLLQHEVIAFKSCYPASNIESDEQLAERKSWYLKIRDTLDKHPGKLFIVVTQPPLNPVETRPDVAARARAFADWLKSDEFLKGHPNIVTFDLFDQLAEADPQRPDFNMLRADYRQGADSHPNRAGNEAVGSEFVRYVIGSIEQFRQHRAERATAETRNNDLLARTR